MGGKRPDQYQIDPREGGATDYKNLPQPGHGQTHRDDTVALDKQRVAQGQKAAKGGQPFLPDVPHPSVHANEGHKINAEEGPAAEGKPGAGNA